MFIVFIVKYHADKVYTPIVTALKKYVSKHGTVLVPGAALCRLAWEISGAGYEVEANEFTPLFSTVADAMFNHADTTSVLCPMMGNLTHNFSLGNQFFEMPTPVPAPHSKDQCITLRMGDFTSLYKSTGPGHRQFGAVVTCFFLDTARDVVDYLICISNMLASGGVWINFGPLNYMQRSRVKLSWEEIVLIAERIGFDWETQNQVDVAYSLQPGSKMYVEQHTCMFSVAKKNSKNEHS